MAPSSGCTGDYEMVPIRTHSGSSSRYTLQGHNRDPLASYSLARRRCLLLQVISILGALAILGAYAANLLGWISPANLSYSVANLLGSAVLTVIAVIDQQLGFILLEGVWALVSLWGIVQVLSGSAPQSPGH
jgi:hypothetical protein